MVSVLLMGKRLGQEPGDQVLSPSCTGRWEGRSGGHGGDRDGGSGDPDNGGVCVCVLGWGRLDAPALTTPGIYFFFSGLKVWGGGSEKGLTQLP